MAETEEAIKVAVLSMGPSDVLVMTVPSSLGVDGMLGGKRMVEEVLGRGARVLVIPSEVDLKVVSGLLAKQLEPADVDKLAERLERRQRMRRFD